MILKFIRARQKNFFKKVLIISLTTVRLTKKYLRNEGRVDDVTQRVVNTKGVFYSSKKFPLYTFEFSENVRCRRMYSAIGYTRTQKWKYSLNKS